MKMDLQARELLMIEYRQQLRENSFIEGNTIYVPVRNIIKAYMKFGHLEIPGLKDALYWVFKNISNDGFNFLNGLMPIELQGNPESFQLPQFKN